MLAEYTVSEAIAYVPSKILVIGGPSRTSEAMTSTRATSAISQDILQHALLSAATVAW